MDIYKLGKVMGIDSSTIYGLIVTEKMEEPVKITPSKLLKLYKKYYGGE